MSLTSRCENIFLNFENKHPVFLPALLEEERTNCIVIRNPEAKWIKESSLPENRIRTVKKLSFNNTPIDEIGISSIASFLEPAPREMDPPFQDYSDSYPVPQRIIPVQFALTHLELSSCKLKDEGIRSLFFQVPFETFDKLKVLILDQNLIAER